MGPDVEKYGEQPDVEPKKGDTGVRKYDPVNEDEDYRETLGTMEHCDDGEWVALADYESLQAKLREAKAEITILTIDLMGADRMAEAIDNQIKINQLDPRSLIADARLDYSEPCSYKYLTKGSKKSERHGS